MQAIFDLYFVGLTGWPCAALAPRVPVFLPHNLEVAGEDDGLVEREPLGVVLAVSRGWTACKVAR